MSRERPTEKPVRSPSGRHFFPAAAPTAVLSLVLLILGLVSQPTEAFGQGGNVKTKLNPIAQITIDDEGQRLKSPTSVFYEPHHHEIFLINGGTSRVVVYNDDFFPLVSAGKGRGVHTPRGIFVTDDGSLYVTQYHPSRRISVLNGAFFVTREIELDAIPELAGFTPSQLVVNQDGTIYLAGGTTIRGVLVMDEAGNLLRRLEPMGMIIDQEAIAAAAKRADTEKWALEPEEKARILEELQAAEEQESESERTLFDVGRAIGTRETEPAPEESVIPEAADYGDIPEEFRPSDTAESRRGLGPLRINNVVIDREGRLYLVSAEAGKIFVYDANETFLFDFGTKGGSPRKLSQPRGVAVDHQRELFFVVDYMRHMILIYDFEGEFLAEVGGFGHGPGWFNHPMDIAIDQQGRLIIPDLFNRRIQILEVEIEQVAEEAISPKVLSAPESLEPILEVGMEQMMEKVILPEALSTPESLEPAGNGPK